MTTKETKRDQSKTLDIFNLAKVNLLKAIQYPYPEGYKISTWWGNLQSKNINRIRDFKLPEEAVSYAQIGGNSGFDHRMIIRKEAERAINYKFKELEYLFPGFSFDAYPGLQDSEFSQPDSIFNIEGRRISSIFLTHIFFYLRVRSQLLQNPRRVLEIGTGYGALSRIFKTVEKNLTYVLVDLPESLFYANSFIGLSFPDARIKYISEPTELTDSELNEYDFVFVPVQNCNTLAYCTFDVAINTFSFQEMPDASVIFWMNFIQKVVNVKAFYSWNYFLTNKRIQSEAGVDQESNLICPVLDPFWNLKYFHLNEHLPRVDCAKRNWLEIFVERIPETERVNIDLSKRGLEYFKMADCFVRGSHYWFGNLWMAIWCDINRAEYIDEFLRGIHEFAHGQSYGIVNVLDQRVPLYPNLKTLLRAVERISKSILRNALSRISSRFHYLKYDIENEYNELDFYRKLKQ